MNNFECRRKDEGKKLVIENMEAERKVRGGEKVKGGKVLVKAERGHTEDHGIGYKSICRRRRKNLSLLLTDGCLLLDHLIKRLR